MDYGLGDLDAIEFRRRGSVQIGHGALITGVALEREAFIDRPKNNSALKGREKLPTPFK